MAEQKFVDVEALEITISQSIDEYWNGKNGYYLAEDALQEINHFPIADVKPIIHAHWETYWDDNYMCDSYNCSNCHRDALTKEGTMHEQTLTKYCPFCGATMDEEEG